MHVMLNWILFISTQFLQPEQKIIVAFDKRIQVKKLPEVERVEVGGWHLL